MLNPRPNPRLVVILGLDRLIEEMLPPALPVGEVLRFGGFATNDVALTLVRLIAVDPCLVATQQLTHDLAIVGIRRRDRHRVDDFALAIDADVPFHAELPLL